MESDYRAVIKGQSVQYVYMQPLKNDKNWKYWPITQLRVTAAQSHTMHPEQWAHSVVASTSKVKRPTSV